MYSVARDHQKENESTASSMALMSGEITTKHLHCLRDAVVATAETIADSAQLAKAGDTAVGGA